MLTTRMCVWRSLRADPGALAGGHAGRHGAGPGLMRRHGECGAGRGRLCAFDGGRWTGEGRLGLGFSPRLHWLTGHVFLASYGGLRDAR